MKNIDQYIRVHESISKYGAGSRHFEYVFAVLVYIRAITVIDFGCGKGVLADQLNDFEYLNCKKYDPAIAQFSKRPAGSFDCLVNTDVLEHIPEDELDGTLSIFPTLSSNAIIIPHLRKAGLVLPSGENAHCTIKKPDEWRSVIEAYYSNVAVLPHDSDRHALLFCSQNKMELDPLRESLRQIASRIGDPLRVEARLNDPWKVRVRRGIKLLLGMNARRR